MDDIGRLAFVFLAGFFIFVAIGKIEQRDRERKEDINRKTQIKKENKKYIMEFTDALRYMSGFKDKGRAMLQSMILTDKEIQFVFPEGTRIIKTENIKDIYISDQEEITQKASAGKVMMLGVAGLAMKDREVTLREFIMIDCIYDNYETTVIIESLEVESKVSALRSVYM